MADAWMFEKQAIEKGYARIAGIDEAGRGPLAGPVVAAAVILPQNFRGQEITDSKKLTPGKREICYDRIYEKALAIGIGIIDPAEIDRINILQASLLAMAIAVQNISPLPDHLLIDGTFQTPLKLSQEAIPKGDGLSISISAASIIAKVTRDRLMCRYHEEYPQYGFAGHKGYPTKSHKGAILRFGCCPIHRRSFKGVKEYFAPLAEAAI